MNSAIYRGWVRHRRREPAGSDFSYRVFQVYLDLDELEEVFRGRLLWSTKGPNVAWFRREDHLGDPALPLDAAVRRLVADRTGARPRGPIRLLTHLRYFGYVMNPVSFYYCFDEAGSDVETVVAEIHNTPWGERHCYVLPREKSRGSGYDFEFPKEFHVSPFMPMEQTYRWRFSPPGGTLAVHMDNLERRGKIFDATLQLERRPITGPELARALAEHPWMTGKVVAAIYWQAFRLRRKRVPFHPHPKRETSQDGRAEEVTAQ